MTVLGSLTVVGVVGEVVPGADTLAALATVLEREAADLEIVLVANGVGADTTLALKALVGEIPDLTVVFLAEPVHDDVARLVGIEHAVGDYVLFCNPGRDDPASIPPLLGPLREGYDLVVAERGDERPLRSRVEGGLVQVFGAAYRSMTGGRFDQQPTGMRVLSRAAALNVAGRADAELRVRMRSIGTGFPATVVRTDDVPRGQPEVERRQAERRQGERRQSGVRHVGRRRGHGWAKGLGLLLSASSMPLRGASYAALAGGGLSAVYSLYVFGVYWFKRDVAAGWTTLSLQLSAMMFVFSVVLLFLSEYVIQIYAASPPRSRRFLVVRELRSPLSRRARLLNVVDADGRFEMGKPAWLMGEET